MTTHLQKTMDHRRGTFSTTDAADAAARGEALSSTGRGGGGSGPRHALHHQSSHFWSSEDEDDRTNNEPESAARAVLTVNMNKPFRNTSDAAEAVAAGLAPDGLFRGGPPRNLQRHHHRRASRQPHSIVPPMVDSTSGMEKDGLFYKNDHHVVKRKQHSDINYDDDDEPSIETEAGDWSLQSEGAMADDSFNNPNRRNMQRQQQQQHRPLTEHDIAMVQALDLDYERALEDRQVAWTARYQSVRQSTLVSMALMLLLILAGTTVFLHQADSYWSVSEGLLFSIYTITTVGYGHLDMPSTAVFQIYVILYIFLGIAMLTILVAQVYQCLALEASRVVTDAGDAHAHKNSMRLWLETNRQARATTTLHPVEGSHSHQQQQQQNHPSQSTSPTTQPNSSNSSHGSHGNGNSNATPIYMLDDPTYSMSSTMWDWTDIAVWMLDKWDRLRNFLRYNEFGRGVSVVLPFAILIALGAGVIGPLEGWSPVEATYFAVVSLTTVGFGDYYPTRTASIWFCIIWLPFSVGFMSLYLANVAAFYIRLSDRNVARIGRILRKRLQRAKERAEQERRAVLRRALRGQYENARDANIGGNSSLNGGGDHRDELEVATQAAEAAQRPLVEVLEGITVITVDHSAAMSVATNNSGGGLRQATHRMRGFDTIPTLDDSPTADDLDAQSREANTTTPHDGMFVDVESPRRAQGMTLNGGNSSVGYRLDGPISYQRQRILQNSQKHMELVSKSKNGSSTTAAAADRSGTGGKATRATMTMKTMKDVLRAVHRNNQSPGQGAVDADNHSRDGSVEKLRTDVKGVTQTDRERPKLFPSSGGGDESEFLSVRSIHTVLHHDRKTVRKKPSFALRALVQERFAEIIAADIAGYQSCIEIKEYTLSVTIDTLKETAEKWLVPRRARKAFRAVAFEALYFVGEHGLITRGPDALFALTPFEFHEIFSPLLAAFGDAETMELWLERTQALAEVDLSPSFTPPIAAVVAARLPSSIATTVPDGPTSITKIAPSDGATASSHLKDEPCVEADTVVENSSTTATTTLGSKGDTKVELPDIT